MINATDIAREIVHQICAGKSGDESCIALLGMFPTMTYADVERAMRIVRERMQLWEESLISDEDAKALLDLIASNAPDAQIRAAICQCNKPDPLALFSP